MYNNLSKNIGLCKGNRRHSSREIVLIFRVALVPSSEIILSSQVNP